jgi:hypothetical protein
MRPILLLIGLSLASVIAAILAFECWDDYRFNLRQFPRGHDGEIAFAVPRFFGIRVPTDATVYKTPFGATEKIRILGQHDQFGMRSADAISKFPHRRNMALLGDSFTWGAENQYTDTLQHRLEIAFPHANVLNFAISGSNSNYFAAMAKAFLGRVKRKLDVVVVGIYTDLSIGDIPRIAAVDRYGDQVIFDQITVSGRAYQALMMSSWRRLAISINTTMRQSSSTYNRIFPPQTSPDFAVSMTDAPDGALEVWRERSCRTFMPSVPQPSSHHHA